MRLKNWGMTPLLAASGPGMPGPYGANVGCRLCHSVACS
jgi:hypothetical protein